MQNDPAPDHVCHPAPSRTCSSRSYVFAVSVGITLPMEESVCTHMCILQEMMGQIVKLLALVAGSHQHCSDVPPQSLRHWFTFPSHFWLEESMCLPTAVLPIFWCGFWPHRPFLPVSFPCQYTCGMGGGPANRRRMATIFCRYSRTDSSMLPRLTFFTQFCHNHKHANLPL